jgi:hypothetical protein
VLPRLFLGNAAAAVNQDLLRAHGITHVVTAAVGDGVGALFPDQFLYHEVCIEDRRSFPTSAQPATSSRLPWRRRVTAQGACGVVALC